MGGEAAAWEGGAAGRLAPLDTRPSTPFTIFFTMSPPGFERASQSLQRLCQRANLAVAAINCCCLALRLRGRMWSSSVSWLLVVKMRGMYCGRVPLL